MSQVLDNIKTLEVNPTYETEVTNGVATIKVVDSDMYKKAAEEIGISKKQLEEAAKFDEAYLNAVVDSAIEKVKTLMKKDESVVEATVESPFGLGTSSKVYTNVVKEKEWRVPGSDKKIKKSQVKTIVKTTRYNISKSKIKQLEKDLTASLLG